MSARAASATVALMLSACDGGGSGRVPDAALPIAEEVDLALVPEHELDLLLVIDDSLSTSDMKIKFAEALPSFLAGITRGRELPDLHVGVVTSDYGQLDVDTGDAACQGYGKAGALQNANSSGVCAELTDLFLVDTSDGAGGRTRNYAGDLVAALECLVYRDNLGCGFEQPLASMRAGLLDTTVNAGFVRPMAQLAVIVLMDEDDCSAFNPAFFGPETPELGPLDSFRCFEFGVACDEADPRAEGPHTNCRSREDSPYLDGVNVYASFLENLRPGRVHMASVVGAPTPVEVGRRVPTGGGMERADLVPSCTFIAPFGNPVNNDPGVRLDELARSFGARGASMSVCDDIPTPLHAFGEQVHDHMVGQPCFRRPPYDLDATQPGVQPICTVTVVGIDEPRTELAACNADSSNPPCWRLIEDTATCALAPTEWRLDAVGVEPVYGRHVQARCQVVP